MLRPLREGDDATKFSLGDASHTPLKIFLKKSACDSVLFYQKEGFVLLNSAFKDTDEHPTMFFDLHKEILEKTDVG